MRAKARNAIYAEPLPTSKKMSNQQYIKSKIRTSEVAILMVGGISMIILGGYFMLNEIKFIGAPITVFGLYRIYTLINYDILYVNKNEVLIKSITGATKKIIPLNTLKYYTEIQKENAAINLVYRKWSDLILFSDGLSLRIYSSTYTNYPEIKKILTRGLKKNLIAEQEWDRKNRLRWGYGLLISGLAVAGFIFRKGIPHNELIGSVILMVILILPITYGVRLIKKNKRASR